MNTPDLFATLPGTSLQRPCRECGEPITLKKTPGGRWVPFESDPVVVKIVQDGDSLIRGGRILEMLDAADRHTCRGRRT